MDLASIRDCIAQQLQELTDDSCLYRPQRSLDHLWEDLRSLGLSGVPPCPALPSWDEAMEQERERERRFDERDGNSWRSRLLGEPPAELPPGELMQSIRREYGNALQTALNFVDTATESSTLTQDETTAAQPSTPLGLTCKGMIVCRDDVEADFAGHTKPFELVAALIEAGREGDHRDALAMRVYHGEDRDPQCVESFEEHRGRIATTATG